MSSQALNGRTSTISAAIGVLVLLVVLVLQPAPAAFAEDTSDITWSVRPANQSGPDGRSWVELALDPGDQTTDYIAVKNFSDEAVAFKIDAADGYFTDAGRFDMLPPGEPSTGAGTWITVQDTVTVEPAATAIVPFVVRVPENAEPGDHAAGVAVSIRSEILDEDGARIGMESRVGFRVMTRVTGMIDPAVELAVLDAQYSLSWNPFSPGQASVTFEARNSGNARLLLHGTVDAAARSTSFPGESEPEQELLPGESRTLTVTVEQAWPLFLITGEIELTPAVVALDGSALSMDPTVEPILIWAIPWPQLMVCGGVLLLILGLVWGRTQSRRKTAKLVSLAREEGRRAALHDEGGA